MTERPEWLSEWFEDVRSASALHVEDIALAASTHWALSDGAIRHDSGRFFTVVGVRWTGPDGLTVSQPLLKQEEEGTLGFLVREGDVGNEVLAYAKIEPGNVDTVQIAPTCQATRSNISRAHGGGPPPFAGEFEGGSMRFLYDVLQSEQGSRFFGKRNRNVLANAKRDPALPSTHRWVAAEEVLDLLEVDFAVNTDARSVLVCSPWEKLVGRPPFTRSRSGFGAELHRSAAERDSDSWYEQLCLETRRVRDATARPSLVDLGDMEGWRLSESGVEPESAGQYRVRQVRVGVRGREVSSWDQPIIDSAGEGGIDLVCGRSGGVLHFLLSMQVEPGLHNLVQLGPSFQAEPGSATEGYPLDVNGAEVRVQCRQSEEGGRFFFDVNRFRVLDIGEAFEPPDGRHWLTLARIRRLLDESGWLTNEARSALALLLKWL